MGRDQRHVPFNTNPRHWLSASPSKCSCMAHCNTRKGLDNGVGPLSTRHVIAIYVLAVLCSSWMLHRVYACIPQQEIRSLRPTSILPSTFFLYKRESSTLRLGIFFVLYSINIQQFGSQSGNSAVYETPDKLASVQWLECWFPSRHRLKFCPGFRKLLMCQLAAEWIYSNLYKCNFFC